MWGVPIVGFRSTFCTDDYSAWEWPAWFREKYADSVNVPETGALSSKGQWKLYSQWANLIEDIQKAIDWSQVHDRPGKRPFAFIVLFLHDCGGITRFAITQNEIVCTEPSAWEETEHASHGDGCNPDCRWAAQGWKMECR